jgi:hypothetical protein
VSGRLSDARGPVAVGGAAADPVRLGDEYGLGAYQRTQTAKEYPPARGCGVLLVPVAVVMLPTAVVPFVDGKPGDLEFGLIWAPIIGCLLIAGVLLLWRSPPRRVVRTFWYSDGLIQLTAGEPEPRAVRWDRVISLTVRIERADESADYIGSSTICDDGGTSLTTRGAAIAREASRIFAPADGAEPLFAAWSDIRRIAFNARVSVGIQTADSKNTLRIDLEDVPNGFFAHHVIEHAAAQAGIPVEYHEEKRLPPRLPVQAGP